MQLAQNISVQPLPPPDFVDCRDPFSRNAFAFDPLVSGDLPDQSGEEWVVRIGAESPAWRELPHGLAHPSQAHAVHAGTRSALYVAGLRTSR